MISSDHRKGYLDPFWLRATLDAVDDRPKIVANLKRNAVPCASGSGTQTCHGDHRGLLVARHLKTTDDLFDTALVRGLTRCRQRAVQWASESCAASMVASVGSKCH